MSKSVFDRYDDYINSVDKGLFISTLITEYTNSPMFKGAEVATSYYQGHNQGILKMKNRELIVGEKKYNMLDARIPSNIFYRLITQLVNYQVGNGIIVNEQPIDELLGLESDRMISQFAKMTLVQGVSYALVLNKQLVKMYTATQMFTLNDEWTGIPKVAVEFWEKNNISYFRIFDSDGITKFKSISGGVEQIGDTEAYGKLIRKDGTGEQVVGQIEVDNIPIVPFYVNDERRSEMTPNIKSKIDWYDLIFSAASTFSLQTAKMFWLINSTGNGDPEDVRIMVEELTKLGIAVNEQGGLSAEPKTLSSNVEDREKTLRMLENDIYKDFMSMNMDQLTGIQLTATAIKVSTALLKIKASDLYYYVATFIKKLCLLCDIEVESITMKEETITNDFETIQGIYLARNDLTTKKALELNPFIEIDEVQGLLDDLDSESFTGTTEVVIDEPINNPVEKAEVQGKALNGAQTQSLIAIMSQFASKTISEGQAVNLISTAIGMSKEDARKILNGEI